MTRSLRVLMFPCREGKAYQGRPGAQVQSLNGQESVVGFLASVPSLPAVTKLRDHFQKRYLCKKKKSSHPVAAIAAFPPSGFPDQVFVGDLSALRKSPENDGVFPAGNHGFDHRFYQFREVFVASFWDMPPKITANQVYRVCKWCFSAVEGGRFPPSVLIQDTIWGFTILRFHEVS